MAEAQNTVDGLTSQQQTGISAPNPGGAIVDQQNAQVYQQGIIPSTPSATPGPAPSVARYGQQWYDSSGVLQVQIDQYGWHQYQNQGGKAVYWREIVTYT
jgi:hypothetical protein